MVGAGGPVPPASIARLSSTEIDRWLDRLEAAVPRHPSFVRVASGAAEEALVFGDSHGDYRVTEEIVRRAHLSPRPRALVGLGDYIDRPPRDCPGGSAANALFLLELAAENPERVFLVRGNHESVRRIGASPHTLPEELAKLWGPDERRYARLMALLERGPLAVATESGVYGAHAGFPRTSDGGRPGGTWKEDDELLLAVTWPEPQAAPNPRGAAPAWNESDLARFLGANGLSVFLRGHDPELTGRPLYDNRCLTLHSCRPYARYGGVLYARVPLTTPVRTLADLNVERIDRLM